MNATPEKILRYSVLPGIIPRLRAFFASGFSVLASIIAVIYYNIGLLPAGHPYLNAQNAGRFGIHHVIAQAGKNLEFSRRHIDQVVLYFTTLIGLGILALQIVLVVISLFATPVVAAASGDGEKTAWSWSNMFTKTLEGHTPSQDISFIVLDQVFGIERSLQIAGGAPKKTGFFDSCISDLTVECTNMRGAILETPDEFPLPIHKALHTMLHFYTMGIAFIAIFIILYFVAAVVGETVTSGTPFGQRFSRAWVIPRFIVFFALIAPLNVTGNNAGINAGQMIVFSIAKFGSNMATNAWLEFNATAVTSSQKLFGKDQSMLALPNVPEVGGLTQFMHVVRLCMYLQKRVHDKEILPYLVREHSDSEREVTLHNDKDTTVPYNEMGGTKKDYMAAIGDFEPAMIFSRYKTIIMRFGHQNLPDDDPDRPKGDAPGAYDKELGYVEPTCGELHFDITSFDPYVVGETDGKFGIQENYFMSIMEYLDWSEAFDITANCMAASATPYDPKASACVTESYDAAGSKIKGGEILNYTSNTQMMTPEAANATKQGFDAANKYYLTGEKTDWGTHQEGANADAILNELKLDFDNSSYVHNLLMPDVIKAKGWAGAALWYNNIADMNGMVATAVYNLPRPFKYPKVMEEVSKQHMASDANPSYGDRFNPRLQDKTMAKFADPKDSDIAAALYSDYNFWKEMNVQESVHTKGTKNSIMDIVNSILGTQGLFNILKNDGTHPLAMLSYMGKTLVDAAIRNLFVGVVGQGLGAIISDEFFGKLADTAGGFIVQISMIALLLGFMLYYILPFLPFIYFFFAFSGWIKSIFEAVIAMPLWAVAHLKIDGEGLPGPWATNGYFLLLEIFLRPTFIVIGFLASISLFSALVNVLHEIFPMVTMAATGFDIGAEALDGETLEAGRNTFEYLRNPIDEFFYTMMYTIIVYAIGISCFKMIDQVPNNIMRWMGVSVSSFQENAGDPASILTSRMYQAGRMANAQIMQMIGRVTRAAGKKNTIGQHSVTDEAVLGSLGG